MLAFNKQSANEGEEEKAVLTILFNKCASTRCSVGSSMFYSVCCQSYLSLQASLTWHWCGDVYRSTIVLSHDDRCLQKKTCEIIILHPYCLSYPILAFLRTRMVHHCHRIVNRDKKSELKNRQEKEMHEYNIRCSCCVILERILGLSYILMIIIWLSILFYSNRQRFTNDDCVVR